ncbi:precorrin-6A/cobalt-precorrin-6A reductase [Maritimibacter dapengensis]|uniref:Precorrin-6A/cobalt-precorrin-6A reductase n=1 Tax=Maritimibacter dapengensis TaxID=2836868 RepID=A0ABS6T191_9RHOB|nr:precorrin-6A/cobalt-precorrin-6A reductase [Maritimibacter dapengensis]MBV7378498.1 precorrin-6A/cobalt-precorrin-6A reductase [Maritimibacter dapengensis]
MRSPRFALSFPRRLAHSPGDDFKTPGAMVKILLMAGTYEARLLAKRLDALPGVDLMVSLAAATATHGEIAGKVRRGGFGGEAAQAAFMDDAGVAAVIDATHPFAAAISVRTQKIAARLGVPYVQVLRPAWRAGTGDDWRMIGSFDEVRAAVTGASTVLLATGPGAVERIGRLPVGRVICRRIDPTREAYPHDNGEWQVARPPFAVADEVALFQKEGVDMIVAKNSGGAGGRAKLTAARELGLPVVMVARSAQPPGAKVETVEAALDWVAVL